MTRPLTIQRTFIGLSTAFWLAPSAYVDPQLLNACPGYVAKGASSLNGGTDFRIYLELARAPGCNVFGEDIERLQLTVSYETETRLHVKITDASKPRYEVPNEVFPRPTPQRTPVRKSQLVFNYTAYPEPFSFTVYRRSTREALFSTRGHPLIFEDQYLRLKTSLPRDANIYGLGEHTETFRLDPDNHGRGMVRTLWNRDSFGLPNGTNLYGNHPVYFEHRVTGTHGVFLLNSNGMDIKLNRTSSGASLEYNVLGGVLDFYFLAGSETTPEEVAKQYAELAGLPAEVPYWGLGFHQCRFGYKDFVDVAGVISKYKASGIPLETMWADIDYMDRRLIFTLDPQYFPLNRMREIVDYLHRNNQHFIVMTDPAVGYLPNAGYGPYDRGEQLGVWVKNPDGSNHLGLVWPGVTVIPDWFHPKVEEYWNAEFARFYDSETGLDIDGAWIDMNEPASFCEYPCNDPFEEAEKQNLPPPRNNPPPNADAPIFTDDVDQRDFKAENDVRATEEAPNAIVINAHDRNQPSVKRQSGSTEEDLLLEPLYAIENAAGALSARTAYTTAVHANGLREYDTHNLYGTMMSSSTRKAMLARRPGRRPLIITRSTFAGAGRDVGKWLGDNYSTWAHYRVSIAGMLNFASVFGMPMVGSDVCGFAGNTTEELCARWAMLGAFNPFFRNHNGDTSISQEFYIWPKTRQAAKAAIDIRYRLLDYLYTALNKAHLDGTPVLSPLWYKYPKDKTTFPIDLQFFYGPSLLVSPVTDEGASTATYYLPKDTWYDFATLAPVPMSSTGTWVTSRASFTQIPLHIKGGSIIPMRAESALTTAELRTKPFNLIIAPSHDGSASGTLYIDDGETIDPPQSQTTFVDVKFRKGRLVVDGRFAYDAGEGVGWKTVKILGVEKQPRGVELDGRDLEVDGKAMKYDRKRKVLEIEVETPKLGGFEVILK